MLLGGRPFLAENQPVVDEVMDRMDAAARAMSGHAAPDAVHQAGACAACSYEDYLRGTLSIKIEGMPPFEQIAPGAIRTYENDGLAFDDLRLGDGLHLDAVVSNVPTLEEAIKNGLPFRIVGDPVFYEPLAVAVDKGDPEFTARIAGIVEAMHADGTLTGLSEKWFGADLTKPE